MNIIIEGNSNNLKIIQGIESVHSIVFYLRIKLFLFLPIFQNKKNLQKMIKKIQNIKKNV